MSNRIKMYLSLPITGRNLKDAKEYAKQVKAAWVERGYEVITPFEVCNQPGKTYAYYMGQDVEALIGCEGIIMCEGWFLSKGCRVENFTAQVYGKLIKFDKTPYRGRYDKKG